jgi:predicted nucleic acid-binding protein
MARPAAVHGSFLVLDASIAVKLVLPEPYSEEAQELVFGSEFAQYLIIAPLIVVTEVTAAITKAVRSRAISPASARAAYSEWNDMIEGVFGEETLLDNLDDAFEMSLRLHHALHDCLYLALAQSRNATLATCDAILAEKRAALAPVSDLSAASPKSLVHLAGGR